jgi:hypothetical protein
MMIVLQILLGVVLLCILVVLLAVDTRVDIIKTPNSIGAQAALMADSELVRPARREMCKDSLVFRPVIETFGKRGMDTLSAYGGGALRGQRLEIRAIHRQIIRLLPQTWIQDEESTRDLETTLAKLGEDARTQIYEMVLAK